MPALPAARAKSFFGDQVRISITEQVGALDKPFMVTTSITVNANGSISSESSGKTSGSVFGSVSGSVTHSYTAPMSEAEKNDYLAQISGGLGGSQPAMPVIALIAQGHADEAAKMLAHAKEAASPAADFANRVDGDIVEESTDTDVSGGAGAGRKSGGTSINGGVDVSKGGGVQRISRRVSAKEEILAVIVEDRSGAGGNLGFGYGAAAMGYARHDKGAQQYGVYFRLDPTAANYSALRAELKAATTFDQLRALEGKYASIVSGHMKNKSEITDDTLSATLFGTGIDLDGESFGSEGESVQDGRRERTVMGGSSGGGSFTALGVRLNPIKKSDSFAATIYDDNTATGEARTDSDEVDFDKTLARNAEAFSDHPAAALWSVATGNQAVMQHRVDSVGETLSDESYDAINYMAHNKHAWSRAFDSGGISQGALEEWEEIRQDVIAADGDRYKIAKAMAKWQKGRSGRRGDVERLIGDTGVSFDFPDEIADQKPIYDQLVASDPMANARMLAEQGDNAQALRELAAISDRLATLAQTTQAHVSGTSAPGKFAEMQRRISDRRREVRAMISSFQPRRLVTAGAAEAVEPTPVDFVGPPTKAQQAANQVRDENDYKEALEEIKAQIGLCMANRVTETRAFAEAEDELDDFYINVADVFSALRSLEPTYAEWDKSVERLRAAYTTVGLAPEGVSLFAPNRRKWNALHAQAMK